MRSDHLDAPLFCEGLIERVRIVGLLPDQKLRVMLSGKALARVFPTRVISCGLAHSLRGGREEHKSRPKTP
jgi:hypothetical protein